MFGHGFFSPQVAFSGYSPAPVPNKRRTWEHGFQENGTLAPFRLACVGDLSRWHASKTLPGTSKTFHADFMRSERAFAAVDKPAGDERRKHKLPATVFFFRPPQGANMQHTVRLALLPRRKLGSSTPKLLQRIQLHLHCSCLDMSEPIKETNAAGVKSKLSLERLDLVSVTSCSATSHPRPRRSFNLL